jgi:hypothetical protein
MHHPASPAAPRHSHGHDARYARRRAEADSPRASQTPRTDDLRYVASQLPTALVAP